MRTFWEEHCLALVSVGLAVALGLCFRIPYYVVSDFVLGDGGMFAAIIDTIRAGGYAYPEFAGYNQQHIPFAYPPLAFYFAALVTDGLGVSTLTTMTYLPLVVNLLAIAAFVLLAMRLLERTEAVLLAAVVFPLLPGTYEWLIMGGGLTRGAGFLFMLLTLWAATHLNLSSFSLRNRAFWATAGLFALATLSHPETGLSTALALTLLLGMRSYNGGDVKTGGANLVAVGALGVALTSPWWGTVLFRHGPSPFLMASKTSMWNARGFLESVVTGGIFDITGASLMVPAVAGGAICFYRKKWFLPVWFVLVFLVTPRKAPTISAVPYALLAATGIYTPVRHLVEKGTTMEAGPRAVRTVAAWLKQGSSLATNYAVVLALLCAGYLAVDQLGRTTGSLSSVTKKQQQAMQWVKQHTPPSAQFVVLSPFDQGWARDYPSEWFPYVTKRQSLTTIQGLEWAPNEAFETSVSNFRGLEADQYLGGMVRTIDSTYAAADYVAFFTPTSTFSAEYEERYAPFVTSDRYQLVYDNGACLVFERKRKENVAAASSE